MEKRAALIVAVLRTGRFISASHAARVHWVGLLEAIDRRNRLFQVVR